MNIPEHFVVACHRTGSSVICDPPVTTTDEDYVILTRIPHAFDMWLTETGWKLCGDAEYEGKGDFTAYRKGKENIIVVSSNILYAKYKAAMLLAKQMNLTQKKDRVNLFELIIKDKECDFNFLDKEQ